MFLASPENRVTRGAGIRTVLDFSVRDGDFPTMFRKRPFAKEV
jgi:hypothetical protein